MKAIRLAMLVMGSLLSALCSAEQTATLTSIADTGIRDTSNPFGSDPYMYIYGASNTYHMGYVRFDLRPLDIHTVVNAQLVMTVSGGAPRNDNLTTGRFAAYGLNHVPGNTPQDWNEAALNKSNTGLEVNWANGGGTMDFSRVTNLDANDGAGTTESIAGGTYHTGTTMTLTGQPLVNFLQSRVDDNGLATFIIRQRDGGGRGYGLATKENPEQSYRPALQITYVPADSPRATDPWPKDGDTITGQTLSRLSWKGWGADRYEVWFGPGQANETNYPSLLTRIAVIDNPTQNVSASIPEAMLPLAAPQTYTWVVQAYASDALVSTAVWRFSVSERGRLMENLGRGVVATRSASNQAFISWRLLGTDPEEIAFNLYRQVGSGNPVRVNTTPLTGGTNYQDNGIAFTQPIAYFVRPVINGQELAASGAFTLAANIPVQPCVVVPLSGGDTDPIHFVWVGDLTGDGEYDFVVDRLNWQGRPQKLEAFTRDGTRLWVVNLGPNSTDTYNIEPGSATIDVGHWDGVTVYDLDCDGKAEVVVRTANGVTFGDGGTLVHPNNNVQFISVLDGMTGAERARIQIPTDYIADGPMAAQMGIGYLNGRTPSIIASLKNRIGSGAFNMMICAWDFDGQSLAQKWKWKRGSGNYHDGHNIRIVDVTGDGQDEIGHIGFMLKGDGTVLYNLADTGGVVHGDRWHIGKFDPARPGLQGYGVQQDNPSGLLEYYYDAATGEMLWQRIGTPADLGRGDVGDVDPRTPGFECWAFNGVWNLPTRTQLAAASPWPVLRLWWDGDDLSESFNDGKIEKWIYSSSSVARLVTTWNYEGATRSDRGAPMFYGDIFGDWREETVQTNPNYTKLVIFTTNIPTARRLYTLPHNPAYRNSMTVKGYMQSHHLDYYLGHGMETPPRPKIEPAGVWWNPADITRSGQIDLNDFTILASQWLGAERSLSADIAPFGGDGQVNLPDLLLMADNWLIAEEQ